MSLAALVNLGFAGGQQPIKTDANTIQVRWSDTTLHIYRGIEKNMTVYIDKDGKKRVSCDWSEWLPSGVSIATSTWSVQDNNSLLTLASAATDGTSTEVYVSGTRRGTELYIENTIVTDAAIPETETQSVLVKVVRRV